jgi:AbrB family looped-hinge helix DNA binding protein
MRGKIEECFFGSVTVGERGQVVIPADLRKACDIEAGDRLLVLRNPMNQGFILTKIDEVEEVTAFFRRALDLIETEAAAADPVEGKN